MVSEGRGDIAMAESVWHRKVRREILMELGQGAYSAHEGKTNLNLYREKIATENCLSDVDIILTRSGEVTKIVEVESELNPKKIMGIVLATHTCNKLVARGINEFEGQAKLLDGITLEIVYRESPPGSKKDQKLRIMMPILKDFIEKNRDGSIAPGQLIIHSHPR